MGINQQDITSEEWEVVEAVANLLWKDPFWLAGFNSNSIENHHIIYWDLCDTGLIELPANIGNLRELRKLNLGRNQILELPESIGQLKKLESLTINSDVFFPPAMGQCTSLKSVSTRDKGSSGGTSLHGSSVYRTLLEPLQAGTVVLRMRQGLALINAQEFAQLSVEQKKQLIRDKKRGL